jgi:DNA-directed RNA polymerase specialized sigma24 family protein
MVMLNRLPVRLTGRPRFAIPDGGGIFGYHAVIMSAEDTDWAAQDWDDLVPRLLLLAVSRLYRMTWRGRRGEAPPGAAEAEDYVNDAISKTISGVRVWNSGNCTLFQHLAGVIVSDVGHAATSTENRTTMAPPDDPPGDRWPPDPADDSPDQEQAVAWKSEQRRLLQHLDGIDSELAVMAGLMLVHDMQESEALAEAMGVPAAEIANRRKRLKRAVAAYMAEEAA